MGNAALDVIALVRELRLASDHRQSLVIGHVLIVIAMIKQNTSSISRPGIFQILLCVDSILTHKTRWEGHVCSDFTIDLDCTLLEDFFNLDSS